MYIVNRTVNKLFKNYAGITNNYTYTKIVKSNNLTSVNFTHGTRWHPSSSFLYVLTPEGDIRRVPGNQVLGVFFFC